MQNLKQAEAKKIKQLHKKRLTEARRKLRKTAEVSGNSAFHSRAYDGRFKLCSVLLWNILSIMGVIANLRLFCSIWKLLSIGYLHNILVGQMLITAKEKHIFFRVFKLKICHDLELIFSICWYCRIVLVDNLWMWECEQTDWWHRWSNDHRICRLTIGYLKAFVVERDLKCGFVEFYPVNRLQLQ